MGTVPAGYPEWQEEHEAEEVVLRTYKEDAKRPYLQAGNLAYGILRLKDPRVLGVV